MDKENKYKKLGNNIALMTIGSFASRILSFLFIPLYTAVLTTEEYGTTELITTTVTWLFPIFSLVICESMMRFALDDKSLGSKVYREGTIVWIVGFVILCFFSPILRLYAPLRDYVLLLIMYYFSYSLFFNLTYYLRGINRIKIYTMTSIIQTGLVIIFNLAFLVVFRLGVTGFLLAYILSNLFVSIFVIVEEKLYLVNLFKGHDTNLLKSMLLFSIPLIPNQLSWWINNSSDKYLMAFFMGTAATGIYSIAYKIPSILNVFVGIFSSAWRISSVDEYGTEENRKFYNEMYDNFFSISTLGATLIIAFNDVISSIFFSKDFYAARAFVPILVLAILLNGFADFAGSVFIAEKKTTILFISTFLSAVVNIILNILLIPSIGGYGAAIATCISFGAMWILRLALSRKYIHLSIKPFKFYFYLALIVVEVIIMTVGIRMSWLYSALIVFLILLFERELIINTFKHIKNGGFQND